MRQIEVLCIEDNEADRKLLEAFLGLGEKNCRLRFAHDDVDGLDYLHKRGSFKDASTPDFVILDLNLPF